MEEIRHIDDKTLKGLREYCKEIVSLAGFLSYKGLLKEYREFKGNKLK